jgi:hypothetical protein
MPENTEGTGMTRRPGHLNENQQTRLRITCRHIDRLLSDIDDILHTATSQSPFPRYPSISALRRFGFLKITFDGFGHSSFEPWIGRE